MKELCADLHMHSRWSDGELTPHELARRCRAAGLDLISITDHDTLGDTAEKRAAAEEAGLAYVVGWEISAYGPGLKVHVLGYGCAENDAYRAFLEQQRLGALERAEEAVEKCNAHLGLDVTLAEVLASQPEKDAPLHTMFIVKTFARRLGMEPLALYDELFLVGKPAYSEISRPTPEEAIDVIHASGGIAVLAHPGRIRLGFSEREKLMLRLTEAGLDGLESVYTTHTSADTAYFDEFCAARGMYRTGGSDFHFGDGVHFLGKPDFSPDERFLRRMGLV